jgi:hypothetical protein
MANVLQAFGTSTSITITLNSLGSGSARESTAIDNTSNLYLDALVRVSVSVGTVANPKEVRVYVVGSEDGTVYEDPATGADAAITLEDPPVTKLARVIPTPTSSKVYEAIFSVAQCFGGSMPRKWSIIVENQTGAALAGSSNSASYSGIYNTVA